MKFWNHSILYTKRIYADAGAATPLSTRSRRELIRLLDIFGNAGALHKEAVAAKNELEKARVSIAKSIGAHADEIIFTGGGTESNNVALHGAREHAITSAIEHQSVLEPLRALKKQGLELTELEVDTQGLVDPKKLAEAITDNTSLISIQLVNSEIGTIQPIREISKVLRKKSKKIFLHTDASQAPLWLNIKVDELHADLMTLDAQKVMGPKGVGVLYVRRGVQVDPLILGGGQERGLRSGTENIPLAGAFAVALEESQIGVEERAQKVSAVRDQLWREIKNLIPDAILNGPQLQMGTICSADGAHLRVANNLNISIPDLSADMAVIALDAEGIAASTRSACSTGDDEPSHVIKAILAAEPAIVGTERSRGAIRFTFLPDITFAQARRIASMLKIVTDRYRTLL